MKFTIISAAVLFVAYSMATVQAAASFDPTVACDPNVPEICRGSLEFYTPSPAVIDLGNGKVETTYVGGYHWHYSFVRGLPDGYVDAYNGYPSSYGIYDYGPSVSISLDDDKETCTVTVGNEACSTCSVCKLGTSSIMDSTFSADCRNLVETQKLDPEVGAGKLMECESTLPFFYPLEVPNNLPGLPPPPAVVPAVIPSVDLSGLP